MSGDANYQELLTTNLPLLPLRNSVLFPNVTMAVTVGRERSLELLEDLRPGDIIAVGVQRDAAVDHPVRSDVQDLATLARVRNIAPGMQGPRILLEGLQRFEIASMTDNGRYWEVEGKSVEETESDPAESERMSTALTSMLRDVGWEEDDLGKLMSRQDVSFGKTVDKVAAAAPLEFQQQIALFIELDITTRIRKLYEFISELQTRREVSETINDEVKESIGKAQRDSILREQMKAIKKQLGDGDGEGDIVDELREQLEEAGLPEEAWEVAEQELRRLESTPPERPEHNIIRNYLELMAELPWSKSAETNDDIDEVQHILDETHYGMEDIKERVLQYLAVTKLSENPQANILCLAGPPGVGKTSIAQAIGEATGRPFVRISLGGVRDEAEIRGHRKTYVGAMPGRIVKAMRKAGVKNPIVLLDEIDKVTKGGFSGNPEDALLEVLDPEQNSTFTDHFLEVPFDLSDVLFIGTANYLENLSPPLRDRLEIIELSGYTPQEKVQIARRHLLPKRMEQYNLSPSQLPISDEALESLIVDYTREAGVRELDRQLTKLTRVLALDAARAEDPSDVVMKVDSDNLDEYLGKKRFFNETAARTAQPGVATGMAWTPAGGDILFIETSRMFGKGSIEITGKLGDVMQESARAALAYLRSHADDLNIDPKFLENQDLHIHVPAGAVPKDGPSAGVTMFTALTSLLTGRRVRPDTAMTGEVTLRGRVLPVGGIKEKVLAAHRAGIQKVLLPYQNERDLDDIPEEVRENVEIVLAEDVSQVLEHALEGPGTPLGAGSDTDKTAHAAA
ncbi:MAG: endopeptidase La [Myxococcota bacterium]